MSAVHFIVGRDCNNGCRGCLWTRRLELAPEIALPPTADVRGRGIRLAGREPTLRADLAEVVAALRAAGVSGIEIETNGRMLGYPSFVKALRDAGTTRLVIKLFGGDEASWDRHTRVEGSYAQTLRGIDVVRRGAPRIDLVALIVPGREPGTGLRELVDLARRLQFRQVRVDLRLARLDLNALPALAREITRLVGTPPDGMRIDVNRS